MDPGQNTLPTAAPADNISGLDGYSASQAFATIQYTALNKQLYFIIHYLSSSYPDPSLDLPQSFKMPAAMEPTQQAPMTSDNGDIVTQQPSAEPQPDMTMRGGEEAGCEICCGLCACDEGCC
ncbi:hypothetical protein ACKAV7_001459 [Fusarium commune]